MTSPGAFNHHTLSSFDLSLGYLFEVTSALSNFARRDPRARPPYRQAFPLDSDRAYEKPVPPNAVWAE